MKRSAVVRLWLLLVLLCGMNTPGIRAASRAGGGAAHPARRAPFRTVTLEIRHRVFPDFLEKDKAALNTRMQIGDTDYNYKVVDYVPDFAMDLKNFKVISRSPEPNNPAFKIIVRLKNQPQDTTWAMLKMPPHFARKSLLAFKVMRIDFPDRAPVVAPDTGSVVAGKEAKR